MEEYLYNILSANKDKGFIKRVLNPEKYPTLDNKDGTHSTHSMAWGETNGKYVVFPTVLYNGKKLTRYDPSDAWKRVYETGNFIEFDTPEEAEYFSREYKQYWKK